MGNGQGSNGAPKPSRLDLWRAQRKLERARAALDANRTAWAWFAAHEAAELAARSIHRNGNGRERMVARLLLHAADHVAVPEELVHKAALLDGHYIPHQNGHVLTPPPRGDHRTGSHTAAATNSDSAAEAHGVTMAPANGSATAHANGSTTAHANGSATAHANGSATLGNPNAPSSSIAVQTAEEILAFAKSTFRKLSR